MEGLWIEESFLIYNTVDITIYFLNRITVIADQMEGE